MLDLLTLLGLQSKVHDAQDRSKDSGGVVLGTPNTGEAGLDARALPPGSPGDG